MDAVKRLALVAMAWCSGCAGSTEGDTGDAGTGDGSGGSDSTSATGGNDSTSSAEASDDGSTSGSGTDGSGDDSDTGSTGGSGDDGDSGDSGSEGSESGSDGTTGGALPGDANAVDWPAACEAVASSEHVCLAIGSAFDEETAVVAFSLETGATCVVQTLGFFEVFDVAPHLVWIGDELAWPGEYEIGGRVVNLDDGVMTEIEYESARFFEHDDGVLVDLANSSNYPYYDSIDALVDGTPAETYALGLLGGYGVAWDGVLHTYAYDGSADGAVDLGSGSPAPALTLMGYAGNIDGLSHADGVIAVLDDEVVYLFDDATGGALGSQPIASEELRGLACSVGLVE